MITLYHCVGARSFRPLWLLEELRLKYQLKILPFPPRVSARSYLEINPLGTVPWFDDGNAQMTESVAICQYIAERYDSGQRLSVSSHEADYGRYLNYLSFGEATLTFPQTLVLRYERFEQGDRRQPQVAEDYGKWFHARLRTLDAYLGKQDYICTERFTVADISVGYALRLADEIGLGAKFAANVAAYLARLKERPAFVRATEIESASASAEDISTTPVGRINAPGT